MMGGVEAYPLKFEPIYKQRIWGGRGLQEVFGRELPAGQKIGESWELADLPNDKSVIVNGELAGLTLRAAIERYPSSILDTRCRILVEEAGAASSNSREGRPRRSHRESSIERPFPLLIKLLDCQDVLSVQVHPDAATCKRMGKGQPKTECWYIISAAPGAVIYKGLKKGRLGDGWRHVTREQFARAIKDGTVADMLSKTEVCAGECHFLPAGTAHAIGPGLLIAEIQTPSDTTYRVFDWNRVDEAGKPRELHVQEALESIHFGVSGEMLPVTTVGRLAECEYFTVDKGHQAKNCELLLSPGRMKVLIVLSGFGTILGKGGSLKGEAFGDVSFEGGHPQAALEATTRLVEFRAGDCLLVPAAYEGAMRFAANTHYLTVTTGLTSNETE